MFDKELKESGRKRSRTLPKAPNEETRSRSLPKTYEQVGPRDKSKDRKNPVINVDQSLSQSIHTLSKKGMIKTIKEDIGEVPVIVDDVTKWISGVNENTTCQDIIRVILERETVKFQVR